MEHTGAIRDLGIWYDDKSVFDAAGGRGVSQRHPVYVVTGWQAYTRSQHTIEVPAKGTAGIAEACIS